MASPVKLVDLQPIAIIKSDCELAIRHRRNRIAALKGAPGYQHCTGEKTRRLHWTPAKHNKGNASAGMDLEKQKVTIAEIAQALGVKQRTVCNYLTMAEVRIPRA